MDRVVEGGGGQRWGGGTEGLNRGVERAWG